EEKYKRKTGQAPTTETTATETVEQPST
ncbi:sodium:alanine/glycine symporter, partial [Vibrio parahaemolyticus]